VKRGWAFSLVATLLVAGCSALLGPGDSSPDRDGIIHASTTPAVIRATLRYVALGDSYTIGVGVKERERWPNQLARALQPEFALDISANLAASSTTSRELIQRQLPLLQQLDPQLISILIGVNDVIKEVDPETYRANVATILDAALRRLPPERILVVTTPDYSLTPRGGIYRPREQQGALIDRFNAILADEAAERGLPLVDISPVADRVAADPSLVGPDELSPSPKQYAGWVELIAPTVREMLREQA
jgi:lysophospholipase L1-like esterase